ncbi:MAG: hypothetical protein DRH12_15155 [Deltaproteobacteria bacterium]|nr:MAG: hypothetical protein DRH12_15155 [Deltaproteobacteria bacterium]
MQGVRHVGVLPVFQVPDNAGGAVLRKSLRKKDLSAVNLDQAPALLGLLSSLGDNFKRTNSLIQMMGDGAWLMGDSYR